MFVEANPERSRSVLGDLIVLFATVPDDPSMQRIVREAGSFYEPDNMREWVGELISEFKRLGISAPIH
jgi:hypothetical protein